MSLLPSTWVEFPNILLVLLFYRICILYLIYLFQWKEQSIEIVVLRSIFFFFASADILGKLANPVFNPTMIMEVAGTSKISEWENWIWPFNSSRKIGCSLTPSVNAFETVTYSFFTMLSHSSPQIPSLCLSLCLCFPDLYTFTLSSMCPKDHSGDFVADCSSFLTRG